MDQLVPLLGYWTWLVAAGVLLILELLARGVFFIWLAIAAVLVGAVHAAFGLQWQMEFLLFGIFAVISALAGRKIMQGRAPNASTSPYLNQRMLSCVGTIVVLQHPIRDGRGKVMIDDILWDVAGPDCPAGTRVKVNGVDGLRLLVEPV